MEKHIWDQWNLWSQQHLADTDLQKELELLLQNECGMYDCFYRDLEFGTGGLRGLIGVGTNRMNIYTVGKATQGYANYLNQIFPTPSVAIAYDSRIKSDIFAKYAAEVFAANRIQVYLYPELMPTPALSFAVRCLQCSGGIVITASHNPAAYNGYKVYGSDGCQITTETAASIQSEINLVDIFSGVKKSSFDEMLEAGTIRYIDETVVDVYISAVSNLSLETDGLDRNISVTYTPLNGSGLKCVTRTLKENGFANITVVAEQAQPDGNFPTCPSPNPEIKEALALGILYAERNRSDLLLATDPDSDRVGTAVKTANGYVLISGNEMGVLLLDYICKRRLNSGKMPKNPVLIKTIVTTDMAKKVASHYNVSVVDVLTGFKFIGEQIGLLEKAGEVSRFIFGFEESCGYLPGGYVRDKDGVSASLLICEMCSYYKSLGLSLLDVLNQLYKEYGCYCNTLHNYTFDGAIGLSHMKALMERFRADGPETIGGKKVLAVSDYLISRTRGNDETMKEIHLPKSDVLKYHLQDQCSVVIRPSGTEPKLKLYISVCASDQETAQKEESRIVFEMERYLK